MTLTAYSCLVDPEVDDDGFERIRQQYPPIISTGQVAELLDINPRTVLMMAADGRLPASRLPGSRKFHFFLEDVLKTLRKHMVEPGDPTVMEEALSEEVEPEPAPPPRKAAARRAGRSTAKARKRG